MHPRRPIIVASNRGPVSYVRGDDGHVEERRGVGGLVTAVGGAVRGRSATWIAAPSTEEDRRRIGAGHGVADLPWGRGHLRARFVDIEPALYDAYYNDFSNRILWFVDHGLWDRSTAPDLRAHTTAWEAYGAVAERFAGAILEEAPDDALALPQDYHLGLVPRRVRAQRPDLPIALFWHTPFPEPAGLSLLPSDWARAILEGLLGADLIGFHSRRWADRFLACCVDLLGARTRGSVVHHAHGRTKVGVYPIGVDVDTLTKEASSATVGAKLDQINDEVGDRVVILRVDRTELTKNIVRGFQAYERLLVQRPDLHGRVVHLALLSPSRRGVPEYEEYIASFTSIAERINDRFGTTGWTPLTLAIRNDFAHTLAAYRRYDVLLVNPVSDGMNLIAREGPLLNERDGVLVLSRNAGAADALGVPACLIDPFDVEATAAALAEAVDMEAEQRAAHAAGVRAAAAGMSPDRWLAAQIRDLQRARAS